MSSDPAQPDRMAAAAQVADRSASDAVVSGRAPPDGGRATVAPPADPLISALNALGSDPTLSGQARQPAPHLQKLGDYTIVAVLGAGGMGIVYEAEQQHPRRRVALKVVRPTLITRSLLKRFELEAEVLGRLDHPGIARVFDAGTADSDAGPIPFFAMELVRGRTLNEFASAAGLDHVQRLRLFMQVCDAVQHAHQQGVIHRDLKPGNILVSDEGQPKILDFGVARIVTAESMPPGSTAGAADLRGPTVHTDAGQIVGTLQYMSPEQAAGDVNRLDTRSDVYALGAIGYELLAQRLPYKLDGVPLADAVRVIQQAVPQRLSTFDRALKGDLETIFRKALEKEKDRRYSSAAELREDVRRFLDHEPITARPPSRWYQVRKFARRHRLLVGTAAAVLVVLVGAAVVAESGRRRAVAAERLAERRLLEAQEAQRNEANLRRIEREQAQTVQLTNQFLTDMFTSVDPAEARGKPVLVRDVLDKAAGALAARFVDRPRVEASLRTTLGWSYYSIGEYPACREQWTRALALDRAVYGEGDLETVSLKVNLANVLMMLHDGSGARALLEEARTASAGLNSAELSLKVLESLGVQYSQSREFDRAVEVMREALQTRRKLGGDDDYGAIASLSALGSVLDMAGRKSECEPVYREALERGTRVLGADHPRVITTALSYGSLLTELGRDDEAGQVLARAASDSRRVMGEDHAASMLAAAAYGELLLRQGRWAEAEAHLRRAHDRALRLHGPDDRSTQDRALALAAALAEQDRWADAEPLFAGLYRSARFAREREVRAASTQPSEIGSPSRGRWAARVAAGYGMCLARAGDSLRARPVLEEAEAVLAVTGPAQQQIRVVEVLVELTRRTGAGADRWQQRLDALKLSTPTSTPTTAP